jgi:hypothetical protein
MPKSSRRIALSAAFGTTLFASAAGAQSEIYNAPPPEAPPPTEVAPPPMAPPFAARKGPQLGVRVGYSKAFIRGRSR